MAAGPARGPVGEVTAALPAGFRRPSFLHWTFSGCFILEQFGDVLNLLPIYFMSKGKLYKIPYDLGTCCLG